MALEPMEHYQVEQLADGIFAAVALDAGWAGCNAGIVLLDDRVLLFDTACTLPAARALHTMVKRLTGRGAAYVVNSHVHDDHINGNLLFAADSTILATDVVRAAIAAKQREGLRSIWGEVQEGIDATSLQLAAAPDPAECRRLAGQIAEMKAFQGALPAAGEIRVPHLSFAGQLSFFGGSREARLIDCGVGHSESDTVLYLPEERLLFAGDLVTSANLILRYGDPEAWLRVLDRLAALEPRWIIPGHGPIEPGPAALDRCRRYLEQIMAQVHEALAVGATDAYADTVSVPAGFDERWYRDNIRFLLGWWAGRA